MTKPRLTAEQHAEIGQALATMQAQLTRLHVQLENAYPRSGTEAASARKIEAVGRALGAARSELENALFREHPEATTAVYYPKP